MKRFSLIIAALCLICSASYANLTLNYFKSNSALSQGTWIKIGVEKTGVYGISYAELMEMGFSDPSKVAVYGRGGRVMNHDFLTNSGTPTFSDDIEPVGVYHYNNTLYFYGLGPEEIGFTTNNTLATNGYFTRKSNNIYTTRGYYFLTDTGTLKSMPQNAYADSDKELERALSYVYHEKDMMQTRSNSGQIFWGERIGLPYGDELAWDVKMPDAIKAPGAMECILYFSIDERALSSTVSYGFKNTDNFASFPFKNSTTSYLTPYSNKLSEIGIPGNTGTVFTKFDYTGQLQDANLDYWVVTYQRAMPSMKDVDNSALSQQYMVLPDVDYNSTACFTLENYSDYCVFDVSTPENPELLAIDSRTGRVSVKNRKRNDFPHIVVFDTSKPQLHISGFEKAYSPVENQNLHSLKDKGADFVIVSTPAMKPYAERLADLHRKYDNIDVVVATTEECYNEFSHGVPDPMAIRIFVRMLYMSPKAPKNLLLFGQLFADSRGLKAERDPLEGIIAFQTPNVSHERGAFNINDYYGCMSDQYNVNFYERNTVDVAVGILPVKFASDAEILLKKIEDYLTRTDFAYYLNKYTAVGGVKDEHTHDIQINTINSHVRAMDFHGTVFTPVSIDAYGNEEAYKKFMNQLNNGCSLMTYFGHGAEQFLGQDGDFFTAADVFKLRNKFPFFVGFAGCQITNTDRGMRGLGETIITSTPYGAIGGIVSSRETWSGQNIEFFKDFFSNLYTTGTKYYDPHRYVPQTIGEIFARLKTAHTFNNELAYQLMCDPAIIIPHINRDITIDNIDNLKALAGEKLTVTGYVNLDDSGNVDSGFNGEVVVRLMEPEKTLPGGNLVTGDPVKNLEYTYRDAQISMAAAEVKNGKFSIDIHVPAGIKEFEGANGIIYACAYNPTTRTGAATGKNLLFVAENSENSSEATDKIPPVIEQLEFNPATESLDIRVSDNLALNLSTSPLTKGIALFVDGREVSGAHFSETMLEMSRPAFSKNVYLDGLQYGEHSARLRVKDAAGNAAEQEIIFTYNPEAALYSLARSADSEPGKTVIECNGSAPTQATLFILNSAGQEVWSGNFSGGRAVWQHTDYNNNPVAPGHYKAYIIERGASTAKGHSQTIDIPVI